MPITFTCPNPQCRSTMTVPDGLAGKQGKCSKCKGPVTVPGPRSNGAASPAAGKSAPPPVPAPVDFEAEALAALSDGAAEARGVTNFIEFNCPQCDEPLNLPPDLAGKRHPCPECRRIIPVPYPKTKDKANWRDTGPKLPTGAKRDEGPAPEGAWGTAGRTAVSTEALKEAGVIKEKEKPKTLGQKLRPYVLVGTPLLVLGVGALVVRVWMARTSEKAALNYALTEAGKPTAAKLLGSDGLLALHGYAGVYFLKSPKPDARDTAREQFGQAVALARSTRSLSSDALMADFAVAQLALGGTADDTPQDRKRYWTETQKLLTAAVREIDSQEGRLGALRRLTAGLIDAGQTERVLPLLGTLYPAADADRSEALAAAGLELERLGKKDIAAKALDDALVPYADKKQEKPERTPLRPAVVALATLLGKPAPKPAENDREEKARKHLGEVDALARQGKLPDARKVIQQADPSVIDGTKLRYLIALGVAAAEAKQGTEDLQAAVDAAKEAPRRELAWPLLRLIEAGIRAGLPAEKLEPAVAGITDWDAAAWASLLLLRARLASSRAVEPAELAEAIPANSPGGLVARLELARHNTRISPGWGAKVKSWDEGPRILGSLGVALGMQKGR
jgi:hypothetical protein